MWSWFGGQSAQKRREAPKEAILKLREQLEMLQKREKYLESQMAEQEAIAKKNVTTNKNGTSVICVVKHVFITKRRELFTNTGSGRVDSRQNRA